MEGQFNYWMFVLSKTPAALILFVVAMVACYICFSIFNKVMKDWDLAIIKGDPKAVAIFAGFLILGIFYAVSTLFKGVMDNILGM